jgi:N-acetylglucosaminyldiphosphoundecaprenol N-acetyl-beta-D-mannosaminyltransferase
LSASNKSPKANVLGVEIDAVSLEQVLARIARALELRHKGYVCLVGVHGVMDCQRDPALAKVMANAELTVPDGMPTVWMGRHQGHGAMQRIAGPDLMLEVLSRDEFRGRTHFLFGGKEGIAAELRDKLMLRYPDLKIAGIYTPPFGPMSAEQDEEFRAMIKSTQPDIVWVGISTPRQEYFMAQYLPLLDTTLMFGVGAAFDFHTGRIADCADWIKRAGLQWLHRLLQDPKHLWKRYLRNNPLFLFHAFLQVTKLKCYPPQQRMQPHAVQPQAFSEP